MYIKTKQKRSHQIVGKGSSFMERYECTIVNVGKCILVFGGERGGVGAGGGVAKCTFAERAKEVCSVFYVYAMLVKIVNLEVHVDTAAGETFIRVSRSFRSIQFQWEKGEGREGEGGGRSEQKRHSSWCRGFECCRRLTRDPSAVARPLPRARERGAIRS